MNGSGLHPTGFVVPSADDLARIKGIIGSQPIEISMKRCSCVCHNPCACKCNCTCGSCRSPKPTGKCPW